jgi:hypothetical protein
MTKKMMNAGEQEIFDLSGCRKKCHRVEYKFRSVIHKVTHISGIVSHSGNVCIINN